MAKFNLRLKARQQRGKGESIRVIAKNLGVSKGSVSLWCSDLALTEEQKENLAKRANIANMKGRMIGVETNKRKKIDEIKKWEEEGIRQIGGLSNRDLTLVGISLYWAEGSKKRGVFSLVNSDPDIIKCIYTWLCHTLKIPKEDFILRVAINEMHRKRIDRVLKYWSTLLRLPRSQFRPTSFIKTPQKKVYENYDNYYGTIVLRIRRSTYLKYRILGLIHGIKINLPR